MPSPRAANPDRKLLLAAYRTIAILLVLLITVTILAIWFAGRSNGNAAGPLFRGSGSQINFVRENYPDFDFQPLYPGLSATEIDQLQRECCSIRFAYEPFFQFVPRPMKTRFVEITSYGARVNQVPAPWPPDPEAFNVFVFGGSTMFGYHLPNEKTVPARLEARLREHFSDTNIWCYNFGAGFHFSSQERARFAALLASNVFPDAAIFVDGLNDFYQPMGTPEFSYDFYHFSAPDGSAPDHLRRLDHAGFDTGQRAGLVDQILARYRRNVHLINAMAERVGVQSFYVAHPVPYFAHPENDPEVYPFQLVSHEYENAFYRIGYTRFEMLANSGSLGPQFLWAADVFKDATKPMYADRVHYNPAGADILAEHLLRLCLAAGLHMAKP